MTRPSQPDLVLVMTDQQRHDHAGWVPGSPAATPHLTELARSGVVFEHSYSASTTCVPARTSLLTGLLDHRTRRLEPLHALEPGEFTLARALRAVGYRTALIGKMHLTPMRADHGFDHIEVSEHFSSYPGDPRTWDGYDHYHDWLAERGLADWRFEVPGGLGSPYPYPEETHPTSWVRDRTLELLDDRDRSQPLFLVVSFPHPHPPLNPPERWAARYRADDVHVDPEGHQLNRLLPKVFREATEQEGNPHRRVLSSNLALRRDELARTYALVDQVDDAVGAILPLLDLDRTVLWYTSDHGDYGARRGLVRKVPWIPFDDLARVPGFAAGGPVAGTSEGPGRRITEPVQSFDMVATFLDLAGAFAPDALAPGITLDPAWFDSISQRPLLTDPTTTVDPERLVWCALTMDWPMVRRGPHKYIRNQGWGNEVLFDVVGDPDETLNLAGHELGRDLTADLRAATDAQLAAASPPLPRLGRP